MCFVFVALYRYFVVIYGVLTGVVHTAVSLFTQTYARTHTYTYTFQNDQNSLLLARVRF